MLGAAYDRKLQLVKFHNKDFEALLKFSIKLESILRKIHTFHS